MTKIDGRNKALAARQIDECLQRLQTDRIDLMQHHEIIRVEDPDRIFAEGGAHEAVVEAQKAGKIRYIGFTGHKDPFIHLRTLEVASQKGIRFDAVQLPLNVFDAHFRSFEKQVLPVLVKDKIGVLGMKPLASGAIPKTKSVNAIECLHYALTLPTSVVITGMDTMERLEQALEAMKTFKPLTQQQIAGLLGRTKELAMTGKHERFKTTPQFDATARHIEWTG
jgi:aryl-alcohol dehydrogenase-like predicted oxidoreductase